jgi:adenosylcobinamide-GDP ribazoletransferase
MEHDIATRLRNDLCSALALLTRLPLPDHAPRGAASAWAWPLVGAALGLAAAGLGALLLACGFPPGSAAAFTLAALALATGALHEDGLADTADGLLGGRSPERRLAIMQDSRIGSFGALALVLVALAAWSGLTLALAAGTHWSALPAAAALSRAAMPALMATLPPARPGGLSARTGRPSPANAGLAAALALLVALLLCGAAALPAALATALLAVLLGQAARHLIGGQTGDILGAAQVLSFAAALSLCA